MSACIALLRAVNVGGRGMVAMADLRQAFAAMGFAEARTLLQSGNVVFDGGGAAPEALEALIERELKAQLDLETVVLVRTADAWSRIIAANPFAREARDDPGHLHVMPLKSAVEAAAVEALQAEVKGPELIRAGPQTLYVTYPDGSGQSKLTNRVIESAAEDPRHGPQLEHRHKTDGAGGRLRPACCARGRRLWSAPLSAARPILQWAGSSAVEHPTFNRMVEGSIPSRPTIFSTT